MNSKSTDLWIQIFILSKSSYIREFNQESMKKPLQTLILGLFVTSIMQAQVGTHFGFQGQFNNSWILNQNNYELSQMDYEYKLGPSGGLSLGYNWDPHFGAQIELNYAFMGQTYKDIVRDFSQSYNPDIPNQVYPVLTYRYVDLRYIQIPMLFKYMEGDAKDAIKYHILGGLQFGYLISAEQRYTADVFEEDKQLDIDPKIAPQSAVPEFNNAGGLTPSIDYFNKLDIGAVFDIGVDIYANDKIYFSPGLRGSVGFLDINSEATRNLDPAKGEKIYKTSHNAFVGVYIGVNFMFGDILIGPKAE